MASIRDQEHCSDTVIHVSLFLRCFQPARQSHFHHMRSQTQLQANWTAFFFRWKSWHLNLPLVEYRYPYKQILSKSQTYKCLIHFWRNHQRSLSARQVFVDFLWIISNLFFKTKRVTTMKYNKVFWLCLNYCVVFPLVLNSVYTMPQLWHNTLLPSYTYNHLDYTHKIHLWL